MRAAAMNVLGWGLVVAYKVGGRQLATGYVRVTQSSLERLLRM